MIDHVLHDYQHGMAYLWVTLTFVLIATFLLFARRSKAGSLERVTLVKPIDAARDRASTLPMVSSAETIGKQAPVHDTVFILPDISHYTRFIASNHIDPDRSRLIIFSLMNAMIEAAENTVELSKIEGDAVLFFTDARNLSDVEVGQTVIAIFDAFFRERRRLADECHGDPRLRAQINELDVKMFIHRGKTARFNFKGTVDHFGADVTILHKLMKNSIDSDRYVMVTEAAESSVRLPSSFIKQHVEEDLEHVGMIRASVFSFADGSPATIEDSADEPEMQSKSLLVLRESLYIRS